MKDCMNCINHSKDGCKVWNCKFTTVEDAKTEFASEELEKIKAEILKKVWRDAQGQIVTRDGFNHGIITATDIIDNHISELKGENQ